MTFTEIKEEILAHFGQEIILETNENVPQPYLIINKEHISSVCQFLKNSESLFFDFLSCLTGVDNGLNKSLEVVYHIYSIPKDHHLVLRVFLDRDSPDLPSISAVYKGADWHEREVYDMFGIIFINHPDLRRILMPSDWVGYPLRKDYQEQEEYHGIKVKY